MYDTLAGNFAGVVQYNKDNRNSSNTANITIDTICDILVDQKRGVPVDRVAAVSNLLLTQNKEKCLDYKYSKMVDELKNVSWKAEMAEGGRQWTYQTCTEFGFFQTSTARPNLFSETFPVDFFVQQCTDIFGPRYLKIFILNNFVLKNTYSVFTFVLVRYNIQLLENAVERTNTLYGGLHLHVTNVVYVHGSIDPWHALGITKSSNPNAPAIFINGRQYLFLTNSIVFLLNIVVFIII